MKFVRWIQNRSLRTKATISVLVIIVLAISASVTATIVQTNHIIASEQHYSLALVAHGVAHACELPIAVGDVNELTRQSRAFLEADDGLLFIGIYDFQNRLMASAVRDVAAWEAHGRGPSSSNSFILIERDVLHRPDQQFNALDLGIDDDLPDGRATYSQPVVIGRIAVAYSTAALQAAQSAQATMALYLGIVLIALVVPAIYIIVRASVKRLESLAHISESISRGDYSLSTNDTCKDEIGTLARTFDTMRATLQLREAEARQFNDRLRDLVQQRTAELEDALLAAEAANASKTQFLANMSHEIRTPMTAILGYAELMIDPQQGPSDRLDCVQTISRNAGHLLSIINDILDISKIEAGKMRVERIDCAPLEVVADVASLMRGRAMEKNLDYIVDYKGPIPETIETDPTRLRQILLNLSGNAIKFTEVGEVRLVVRLVDHNQLERARMRFEVIDTGVGMNEAQLATLFTPFTQADNSTTRRFGGTGLGLSISKRLSSMLGGDIAVTSVEGRGTTFTLEIDAGSLVGVRMINDAAEVEAPQPYTRKEAAYPTTKASLHGIRVLLAEDGPDNQRLIIYQLRRAGAIVSLAENGRVAYTMAMAAESSGEPFHVVLMDMQMPEIDGYSAASKLRTRGYDRPIIALTAHAMAGDRERCLAAGCDDYATKPIDRSVLIDLIAAWATRSHNQAA